MALYVSSMYGKPNGRCLVYCTTTISMSFTQSLQVRSQSNCWDIFVSLRLDDMTLQDSGCGIGESASAFLVDGKHS